MTPDQESASGIAVFWISVGLTKPDFLRPSRVEFDKGISDNVSVSSGFILLYLETTSSISFTCFSILVQDDVVQFSELSSHFLSVYFSPSLSHTYYKITERKSF